MKKRIILYIIGLIVSCATVQAQETLFRNFPSTLYRGGTQNWDIEQMPNGQIAIANNNGLLIYNGVNWMIYPIRNYSTVRTLYYERISGRLYVGGSNEFGYFQVDPLSYQYLYHSLSDHLPSTMRGFGELWKILPWGDRVVFQSKSHLFILDKDGRFQSYRSPVRIETVGVDHDKLILATRRGLEEWRKNKSVLLPGSSFQGRNIVVRSLIPYAGKLLVATQENALMSYDGKQLHEDMTELAPMLRKNQIFCAELHGDELAIGTVRAGLIVKNLRSGNTLYLNSGKGLLNNTVLSAAFDADGYIWLGLDNGISCALTNVPYQNIVSQQANIGTGNASLTFGGRLYLGTNQGLYVQPLPKGQQLSYRDAQPVEGVSGQIWSLDLIDGTILCSADRGLYLVQQNHAHHIDGPDGVWCVCPLAKHPGYLVAVDYLGMVLMHKEGGSYKMVHRIKTGIEPTGNLYEDNDGTLWTSHWQKGIYHLALSPDMKSMRRLETFDAHHGLVMDQGNILCKIRSRIYVSCVDGFYLYDRKSHKLVYDKPVSQIFNTYGSALKITETPTHELWAQKGDFIAIAHPKGKGYLVDSTSYRGIASTQHIGLGNMYSMGNGQSIINSNDGFYLVKDYYQMHKHNYPLIICRISATNQGDSIVYRNSFAQSGKQQSIALPHSLNSIVAEFVCPEYVSEGAVTFSCYLENYDERWSVSPGNTKEYTQLSKGEYILHVKAYNRISGKTQETSMRITILPAWYETIWAQIFYILLACLLFYGVMRYLKYRADRELMIERTKRIAETTKRIAETNRRKAEYTQMQNEKLQDELKHKSSELASSTMNSIHKNDILQKIDEDMKLLSESVRREDKKAAITQQITGIRNDLQSYLNNDEGWAKFEENFNVVYDDFMKKLTAQYTTLKMSDRKLCAYLRMGLNSKDMASLLNMSVRSIETARYRLRKKLNLEAGENLTEFIQNFGKDSASSDDVLK